MRFVLFGVVAMIVALLGVPAHALDPLVLYDNFKDPLINPAKWLGAEGVGVGSRQLSTEAGTDARREVQTGQLRMRYRGYGTELSSTGGNSPRLRLNFRNPATVTAIGADVAVRNLEVTGCPVNFATRARARLFGFFFNAGTTTPGSAIDDVFAFIEILRRSDSADASGVLRVRTGVFRCVDANCDIEDLVGTHDLGAIRLGQSATLLIQWDPDSDRFVFKRDGTVVVTTYALSDAAAPGIQDKRLDLALNIPNCPVFPRPTAFLDARFDNVLVNASAAP